MPDARAAATYCLLDTTRLASYAIYIINYTILENATALGLVTGITRSNLAYIYIYKYRENSDNSTD